MQVFVAEPCGFCYGVKRAVDMARVRQRNARGNFGAAYT